VGIIARFLDPITCVFSARFAVLVTVPVFFLCALMGLCFGGKGDAAPDSSWSPAGYSGYGGDRRLQADGFGFGYGSAFGHGEG
jgi:hypothetical protein